MQAKKLIRRTPPAYPALARAARIEGKVQFSAIIDRDGRISNLGLVTGHPLLVPDAEKAVKEWVYAPTMVRGARVEVQTVIEVEFHLPPVPPVEE